MPTHSDSDYTRMKKIALLLDIMDYCRNPLGKLYKECEILLSNFSIDRSLRRRDAAARHKPALTERVQAPYGQGEVQRQARFGPVHIDASNFVDAIHTIEQGIAMHD